MQHKIDTPYYSQYDHVKDAEWRPKSCGITCVKMLLDWAGEAREKSIDDLIEEGVCIGGYSNVGWSHDALVSLIRNYAVPAYREEFKSVIIDCASKVFNTSSHQDTLIQFGLEKISQSIINGRPVIVSIEGAFWNAKDTHLVLFNGFDDVTQEFFFHDPNNNSHDESYYASISEADLRKYWRRMALFVDKGKI